MKLSAAHLAIIADTLHNSLPIVGRWMYSEETRQATMKDVLALLQEVKVDITYDQPTIESD